MTGPVERADRYGPSLAAAARAVLPHPKLWATAVGQAFRLAPAGWWHRWPPLPRPDSRWTAFRLETQYGDKEATTDPADLVAWVAWCREMARSEAPRVHVGRRLVR